jgi:hypothetical protein
MADDPDFFGRFPARVDLTVLPADTPSKPIGFVCYEYNGAEIMLLVNGKLDETPLTRREDLWVGRAIIAPTLVGNLEAIVAARPDGTLYWRAGEHTIGGLEFDADDRHCWVTTYAANMRASKKLTMDL